MTRGNATPPAVNPHFNLRNTELSDEAIARRVNDMLAQPYWRRSCTVAVTVREGVVSLDGTCSNDRCLTTIDAAILAVTPVRALDNNLSWAIPDCGIGVAG